MVVSVILHAWPLRFVVVEYTHFLSVQCDLTCKDCVLLKTFGPQATSRLARTKTARAVELARQLETFKRMFAIVVHNIRHLVSQLTFVISNATLNKHNLRFMEDTILTVPNSVSRSRAAMTRGSRTRWRFFHGRYVTAASRRCPLNRSMPLPASACASSIEPEQRNGMRHLRLAL
jgi:hypothetical protein